MAISGYSRLADVFVGATIRCKMPLNETMFRLRRDSAVVMRHFFLLVSFSLIANASLAAPPPTVNRADAAVFMSRLWTDAMEVLNQKGDPELILLSHKNPT